MNLKRVFLCAIFLAFSLILSTPVFANETITVTNGSGLILSGVNDSVELDNNFITITSNSDVYSEKSSLTLTTSVSSQIKGFDITESIVDLSSLRNLAFTSTYIYSSPAKTFINLNASTLYLGKDGQSSTFTIISEKNSVNMASVNNGSSLYVKGNNTFTSDSQTSLITIGGTSSLAVSEIEFDGTSILSTSQKSSHIFNISNYSSIKVTEGSEIHLTTEGAFSHGVKILLPPNYDEMSIDLSLDNSSIELKGYYSDVFSLMVGGMGGKDIEFSFNNLSAKASEYGNLIFAAGNAKSLSMNFTNGKLEGDVFSGTLERSVKRLIRSMETTPGTYTYAMEEINLNLYEEATWMGSKQNTQPMHSGYTDDLAIFGALGVDPASPTYSAEWKYLSTSKSNPVNLNLYDTSKWLIGKDSNVDILTMDQKNTFVEFLHDFSNADENIRNTFYNARVSEIKGTGSMLMNVNMTQGAAKGDTFHAQVASGDFYLQINHNDQGGEGELKLVSVDEIAQDETFEFSLDHNSGKVQIGSYIYKLESKEAKKEWWLTLINDDEEMEKKFKNSIFGLFEFAKSIDATLSDELIVSKNKVWLVSFYKLQNFSHSDLSNDLKQQIIGGIAGMTQKLNANFSVGEFFGLNLGYQNIDEEGSIGNIANLTAGAYASYNIGGFSSSLYLRVSDYINDLKLKKSLDGFLKETLNTFGFSASLQLSQKISLFDSNFFVEPKAKASYTYVAEQTYNIGGKEILSFTEKGLVTWLGARIGTQEDADHALGYYLEAGWIHDTNPSISYLVVGNAPDEEVSVTLGKNRFEVGLGITSSPLDASIINFEAKYAKGEGIVEPIKLKFSASTSF